MGTEEQTSLRTVNVVENLPTSDILPKKEKLKTVLLRSVARQRPIITALTRSSTEILSKMKTLKVEKE